MIDSSITHCSNENCSKKESCLRYTNRRNVKYGQTYLSLTEEQCEKDKCYIKNNFCFLHQIKIGISFIRNTDSHSTEMRANYATVSLFCDSKICLSRFMAI